MLRIFGYACLAIISSAILFVAAVLSWWAADRSLPVQIVKAEVLSPSVKPGGKLIIRTTVRYVRECAAHIDRALYDAHSHRSWLPDIDYQRPMQGLGVQTYTVEIDVPAYFESGPAEYRAIPAYSCNWLQRNHWPITREEIVMPFEIESPQ